MKNRLWLVVAGAVALVIVAPLVWFLASPLFINNVVEEEFPAQIPSAAELVQMPEEKRQALEVELVETAAKMPDKLMDEPMPETVSDTQPVLVGQGQFKDADSFHQGSGQAALYQLADGSYVLRFEEFSVTNGPDLHVILSSHPAPASSQEVMQGYLDLGSLKGNIGSQNYTLPAGTDVSQFKSVVIYCQPFQVVFATALLSNNQ
ncbi:MAG: DM13 domain-containing protein [Anaerolineales bacterium]|nr:DM13 domain-containing protein [Anaerolineales bacterium]